MRIFGKNYEKTKYGKSDAGYTLVELVVSMALTAILATAVASIMFPIVSIFMDMQRLSRAQMVADMVTDALRKECASAYVKGVMDVRVLELPKTTEPSFGDEGLLAKMNQEKDVAVADVKNPKGGNVLVLRINEQYEKVIYWSAGISTKNYEDLLESDFKMGTVTSKAVYRLFPKGVTGLEKETMPMETRPGYLHCAYYATTSQTFTESITENDSENTQDISVYYPGKAYDYTNPFSVGAYNGYTVAVTYSAPVYESVKKNSAFVADRRPVYVIATINVYQGTYKQQSEETLVCSRDAVLCFTEDNKK